MATTIKLKNGSGAPAASDLVQGEPAFDLTNSRLYTENGSGAVIEVGSNPSSLSINGTAVTATAAEINTLDGITSSTAELNILDGVTSTAAELNILDGVTATAAELNVLDGVTAFVDEDNMSSNSATSIPSQQSVKAYVDSQTGGGGATLSGLSDTNVTSPADAALLFYDTGTSKWIDNVVSGDITIADTGVAAIGAGVIVNADVNASAAIDVSKTALAAGTGLTLTTNTLSVDAAQTQITSVGTLSSLSVSGTLTLGGTAITSTAAELNILDGVTSTAVELNILDGVTATTAELNILDGVTSTAAELNILDGVTATTAELNYVDGVTSSIQTQLDAKGTGSVSSLSDLGVTAIAAELNILDGVTSTTAELNILDGVTATTAELNILDGVTSAAAELNILDGVTSTAAELNLVDGSTADTVVNSKAVIYGAAGQITANELDVDNIQIDANVIKSTNTNGNIQLFPNGTGYTELYGNTNAGTIRFNCENNSHGVTVQGPAHSAAATYTTKLPDTLGLSQASGIVTADANGVVTFDDGISEEYAAVTSSSNATTVNLRTGTNFSHTLTENTTFTFSNPAASGKFSAFTLKLVQDGSASGYTVTWPGSVDWPSATAPTLTATASAVDYFVFITHDGGTTYYGFTAGQALA